MLSALEKRSVVEIGLPAHHDVIVDVDDPRHRHASAEIDRCRPLADQRRDVALLAHGDEPAGLDGRPACPGLPAVRRVDPAVAEDRVGECPVHTDQTSRLGKPGAISLSPCGAQG
ncbi:hypothetical protein ABIF05_006032 [Bradyrhizobium elkanii]